MVDNSALYMVGSHAVMGWESFAFNEVNQVRAGSGVYAWYCDLVLARRDVDDCLASLRSSPRAEHEGLLGAFLQKRVFERYREAQYCVEIKGKLKPTYSGRVDHDHVISQSLTSRLVENPELLYAIADILKQSIPVFAAPIYIGSATNLRQRLSTHVALMRKYRESSSPDQNSHQDVESEFARDHSFAQEAIVQRKLDPRDLRVFVLSTDMADGAKIPVEHILNRINYPLCGRN